MKTIFFLLIPIISVTLFSFKPFYNDKITLLNDGSYQVPPGIISEGDAVTLESLTIQGINEKIVIARCHYIGQNCAIDNFYGSIHVAYKVYVNKDTETLKANTPSDTKNLINSIMSKYLR